jgi:hypothetical protein
MSERRNEQKDILCSFLAAMTRKVQVNGNTVVEISLKALLKRIWFGVAKLTSIWLAHMILRKQLVIATNLLRKFFKEFTAAVADASRRR